MIRVVLCLSLHSVIWSSPCNDIMACVFSEFHHCCLKLLQLFVTSVTSLIISLLILPKFVMAGTKSRGENNSRAAELCSSCNREIEKPIDASQEEADFATDDAEVVLEKLGMWGAKEGDLETMGWYEGDCEDCRVMGGAYRLLEDKRASLEEVGEAFSVFDGNGDGFITPMELRSVLRRMGFKEGAGLEECRRMVEAYDEDGDGRISFLEFKRMLECAT